MTLRYLTDCLSGLRIWRDYKSVGPAQSPSSWAPCAKAALVLPPLLGVPSSAPYPYLPPAEYAAGSEATPLSPAGSFVGPFSRGEGLLAVPGTINSVNVSPYENITYSMPPVIPGTPVESVDISQSTDVPEPSSIVLVGVGAGAAVLVRRRRP